MTNLSNIYNKNATVKNGGITAFLATASDEDDQLENLQELVSSYLAKAKIAFLLIAIFYGLWAISSLLILRRFLRVHVIFAEEWKTLVEFPVIHHACHVIRKFYSVSVVLNVCLFGVLGYVFYVDGLHSVIGMLIGGILAIVAGVYSCIVGWFVQVYQIMIAVEIFNGFENSDEQLMEPELEARKMEKKKRIRNFYKIFVLRDLVALPAFFIYDYYQAFADLQYGKNGSSLGAGVSTIWSMLTNTPIYLALPLSMAFYIVNKMRDSGIRKDLNPLQRIIFQQAVILSSFAMFIHVSYFTLFLCDVFSFTEISNLIHIAELLIPPVSIMHAAIWGSKKIEKKEVSMPANLCKVEPFTIAGDMEKPPIQTSY
ncbi:hypothetical protein B9Z55_017292 [Caenorhabditis nigoni]|uniref:Serpentine receptor class gamma n=1 Tax=Caenorhabditis nigoni TaxID=1611254 RepID=A0A2G5T907_9PELO|nr:hypothetical protein B9Z55_017292 [Caenorhabditis nigoni]